MGAPTAETLMVQNFDVVVLGGGPGGYPAAIKAAQKGARVALVEAQELGGTCLNRGCIPTKTLLTNAEVLHYVRRAERYGIQVGPVSFDYDAMSQRMNQVIEQLRTGLNTLISSNQITLFRGYGRFTSPHDIKVMGEDNAIIRGEKIIIATGSEPLNIDAFPFDGKRIHSSTSLLEINTLPKKIVIVGAGYIGCEFASLMVDLDVQVVLLEAMDCILPMEAKNVSQALRKAFKKKKIDMRCGVVVRSIDSDDKKVAVHLSDESTIEADMALVAVGRKLNTDDIGLDKAGVELGKRGCIPVNEYLQSSVPHIYAVGDVTAKWLLAHMASHQGLVAADNATGARKEIHYNAVPAVVFTNPEIASVGMTLEQATEAGHAARIGAFPFQALGKAQAADNTEGFAQIVIDRTTGQILGAQVVGHDAANLIAEMTVVVQNELTLECLADTIHAHPTVAEAWFEAALLANETPLHFPAKTVASATQAAREAAHAGS